MRAVARFLLRPALGLGAFAAMAIVVFALPERATDSLLGAFAKDGGDHGGHGGGPGGAGGAAGGGGANRGGGENGPERAAGQDPIWTTLRPIAVPRPAAAQRACRTVDRSVTIDGIPQPATATLCRSARGGWVLAE